MKRITVGLMALWAMANPAAANVAFTGDVEPNDPLLWNSSTNGKVGWTSTGTVQIDNGSELRVADAYLGETSSGTGTVTVTGAGSKWIANNYVYVGGSGQGNLNIEAGGYVSSSRSYLGRDAGGRGEARITGVGSQWDQNAWLYVGYAGTGVVSVEDGGELKSLYGHIGMEPGGSGHVILSGPNSRWSSSGDLFVGYHGEGRLTVSNTAYVNTRTLYADLADLAGDAFINVNGLVLDGDLLFNASQGPYQTLPFGSGGSLVLSLYGPGNLGVGFRTNGSLLITEGVSIPSAYGYLGYLPGAAGTATVSGTGTIWSNVNDLIVGNYGRGVLRIENGGAVATRQAGVVGLSTGAVGEVTVTGSGSRWKSQDIRIGYEGRGQVTVEAGGRVTNGYVQISSEPGSEGVAIVTGATSRWDNYSLALVGVAGTGTLTISSGAYFSDQGGYAGLGAGGRGSVEVDGVGSIWSNSWRLTLGYLGPGSLLVTNGGAVISPDTYVGTETSGVGAVTIAGAGSQLRNVESLRVGQKGTGTLSVVAGGLATNRWGIIGFDAGSTGSVRVAGNDSRWLNGNLEVGRSGSGHLTIEDGGRVSASIGSAVGFLSGSRGSVLVTGESSTWHSAFASIGNLGRGTVSVEQGGLLNSGWSTLGAATSAVGEVTLSGSGSKWICGDLMVGLEGTGTLTVAQGSSLSNNVSFIGRQAGAAGTVIVTGSGSRWNEAAYTFIGEYGRGALRVADGGEVAVANGTSVGREASSTGAVTVTGAGSKLRESFVVTVGYLGRGQLVAEAGGEILSNYGVLGSEAGSAGDALIVGAGSRWTCGDSLFVGSSSRGSLHIAGGGQVVIGQAVRMNGPSLISVDVGNSSLLNIQNGNGEFTNNGILRVVADASVLAGSTHTPVAAGLWSGTGVVQAVGGTWDDVLHVFTASDVLNAIAGMPIELDRAATQRVWISDAATGWNVGMSFPKAAVSTPISMTATSIAGSVLAALEALVTDGDVAGGWLFAITSGHSPGDPVYLSFDIGIGYTRQQVQAWVFDGANWRRHSPPDLNVNGAIASFTVTNFSGYAVSVQGPPSAHLLAYAAGPGGSLAGLTNQAVAHGADGSAVTAVPEDGASFNGWSDGRSDNPRTDTNVTASLSVMAHFASTGGVPITWYDLYGLAPGAGETWADVDQRYNPVKDMNLREEFIADTIPGDNASRFEVDRMVAAPGGGMGIVMQFHSSSNRLYTLHGIMDLIGGLWSNVPGAGPRRGIGGEDQLSDTNIPPVGGMYRLSVEVP